jgi:hypothetical protein
MNGREESGELLVAVKALLAKDDDGVQQQQRLALGALEMARGG